MQISGARADGHGYALLIAASPPARYRVLNAADALPMLAAVPPATLLGTATASVVQLVDPDDPQTVLTHLRTAAAHQGPLLVYLCGQLMLDSRQGLPHLALARTTPKAARYTGLPWHWLVAELQHRPRGGTAVLADLTADEASWPQVSQRPEQLCAHLDLYGAVTPPPPKRRTGRGPHETRKPLYSQALAGVLRTLHDRPPLAQLHERALPQAGLTGGELLLRGADGGEGAPGAAPPPAGPPHATVGTAAQPPGAQAPHGQQNPHEEIFAAARAGRHGQAAAMAAAWEESSLRAHGPDSAEAVHWVEVRADLARLAGDPARSCSLWMTVAATRLRQGQRTEDTEVAGAVDRAHHCWHLVRAPVEARELGLELAPLRRRVPGSRPGAVRDVETRLATLLEHAARPQG